MRKSLKQSALLALFSLFVFSPRADSAVLVFDPLVSTNFESATIGQAISTLPPPWTGAGAASMLVAQPSGTGNSSTKVINIPGATRITAVSPEQALPPSFTNPNTGDVLYFSAWLLKNGGGGAVVFNSDSSLTNFTSTLGGFGMADGTGGAFTYYNGTSLAASSIAPLRNTWYEMALVVHLDTTDYANSLGYIYYRESGATEFLVLPEFNGIHMSWWSFSLNATDFSHYRIDSARNNLQIDNFAVGMVIPEPSAVVLSGSAAIAFCFLATRGRRRVSLS